MFCRLSWMHTLTMSLISNPRIFNKVFYLFISHAQRTHKIPEKYEILSDYKVPFKRFTKPKHSSK